MMGRVSSTSSGMTQSLPALRLLPRPHHRRTASSSKCSSTCSAASTGDLSYCFVAFRFCSSCVRTTAQKEQEIPHVFESLDEDSDSKALFALACFKGEQFKVGDSVYLPPDAFNFR